MELEPDLFSTILEVAARDVVDGEPTEWARDWLMVREQPCAFCSHLFKWRMASRVSHKARSLYDSCGGPFMTHVDRLCLATSGCSSICSEIFANVGKHEHVVFAASFTFAVMETLHSDGSTYHILSVYLLYW